MKYTIKTLLWNFDTLRDHCSYLLHIHDQNSYYSLNVLCIIMTLFGSFIKLIYLLIKHFCCCCCRLSCVHRKERVREGERRLVRHLKHDYAGKDGKWRKHDVVNWWYNRRVKGVQGLKHVFKVNKYRYNIFWFNNSFGPPIFTYSRNWSHILNHTVSAPLSYFWTYRWWYIIFKLMFLRSFLVISWLFISQHH